MMRRKFATILVAAGVAAGLTWSDAALADAATKDVPTGSFSGAFLAARAAELDNDLDSAIVFYRRALAFDPGNKDLQQSLLLALISNGDFTESLPYAEKLKEEPEVERFSRLALAVDAFRKDKFESAQKWLELVLESDLDRLITGTMKSWAEVGEGDVDAALENLDEMDGPDWYGLFVDYHRALILAEAGRDDEAADIFDSVVGNLAAGSGAPDTYMRATEAYASWLASKGEKDKALDVIERSEKLVRGRLTTQALRARIESGKAVEPLVRSPADGASEILLNLATALNRGGGESFVRLYLNYALALRPQNDAILAQLGSVAEQQGQSEEAIAFYKQISESSPMKRIAELQIGLNLADLDRQDEAIQHLRKALAHDRGDMRAYLALGGVYASQKDFESAAKLYDEAVEHIEEPKRDDWNVFYQRGIAYERLKKWSKAEPNFKKALELYPDQPQVLNYLGYSWVDMGMHLEEGLELIKKAVDLRPSDGYIVDSLGWAYYRLGKYDKAVDELERAVSLKPGDPVLNDHLGDAYWRVGRRLEATFQWSQARDLKPDPENLAEIEKKLKDGLPPAERPVVVAKAESGNGRAADVMDDATPLPTDDRSSVSGDGTQETDAAETPPASESAAPTNGSDADGEDTEVAASSADTPESAPEHVVTHGESLWSIAADMFGKGAAYSRIITLNPTLRANPDLIQPGQRLRMPVD